MSSKKQYHQYFSARPVINITTPLGRKIRFVGGTYITDVAAEIEFLDNEVKNGHPIIFVKEDQKVVSEEALDPLAAIKKKAVEEYLAKQKEQADPNRDMGNTVQNNAVNMATSKSIAQITAGIKK